MLYLTCTIISNVDNSNCSRDLAKDLVSVDCGTVISEYFLFISVNTKNI